MFTCIPLAAGTRALSSCAVRIIPSSWIMQAHDTLMSSCSPCHFTCVRASKYAVFYFASLPEGGMSMNVQQVWRSAAFSVGITQLGMCLWLLGQRQERVRSDKGCYPRHSSRGRKERKK